jgi:tRNA 2-selenouridine synthase SelU
MIFLSPTLLLGSLAIAIPLILHFFYRARYRKLPWAAMSFLKLSLEQMSRRLRFQKYGLLALQDSTSNESQLCPENVEVK